jgi:hypothetical protein
MKQLWQLGARELADRVRSEEVSSREVLDVVVVGAATPIDPITA